MFACTNLVCWGDTIYQSAKGTTAEMAACLLIGGQHPELMIIGSGFSIRRQMLANIQRFIRSVGISVPNE